MGNAGINAQYGFLYQRKAFILYALENAHAHQVLTFEGKDDIDVDRKDSIYMLYEHGAHYIQVKSGYIDEACFCKVICNWLLLDDTPDKFTLFSENKLDFDIGDAIVNKVYEYILNGAGKRNNSIAKKTYKKFGEEIKEQAQTVIERISNIISNFRHIIQGMPELDIKLEAIFASTYCQDVTEYDLVKNKRIERLLSYINQEIDLSIKNKKPYMLSYPKLIQLIMKVCDEISDHRYIVDTAELKKKMHPETARLVSKRKIREVRQLYLVDPNDAVVVDGIVRELIYKDFRDVFIAQSEVEIINLEQSAYENYDTVRLSLAESEASIPKKVYTETLKQPISSSILPDGAVYRKGCYVYLTSDAIDPEIQISWGAEDD